MHAIVVSKPGGPEVLEFREVDTPRPKKGEALVRVEAAGVNFIDVYHRTGLYKVALPAVIGSEGAGVVEEVEANDFELKKGDRVAWASVIGSYAEYEVVPIEKLVPVPEGIDSRRAAAAMLQGMTAHYLTTSTWKLKSGETALVHAAAGGTGALIIQMAKLHGARVFGTVSNEEKARIARAAGADEVILYTQADFEAEVMRLTNNAGVNVVYDSVGKTTFDKSLNCVTRRGLLAIFGQSSGPVPPFDPLRMSKSATYITRPSLGHYTVTRDELLWRAGDVFEWVLKGTLRLRIVRELPLRDAAEAHRVLEARMTTGKVLLIPS